MSEENVKHTNNSIAIRKGGLVLSNQSDLSRFAMLVVKTDLCPKSYKGKPEEAMVAMQFGMEIGLPAMQSLQNITVINGTPCVWGDAVPGLCYASKEVEDYKQEELGTYPDDNYGFKVTWKRAGVATPVSWSFTIGEAKTAGIWGRNVWKTYPKIMLRNRARTFASRTAFPDYLKGLSTVEEMRDLEPIPTEYEDVSSEMMDALADATVDGNVDGDVFDGVDENPNVDFRDRITRMINVMVNDDPDLFSLSLQSFTTFKGKDDKISVGKSEISELTTKQLPATYGKVKPEFLKYCEEHGIENTICGQH